MMFCGRYSTLVLSAFVLLQTVSIAYGKLKDLNEPSEIFHKYHTAVVTVIANTNTGPKGGTGFAIDPQKFVAKPKGKRFVITAAHAVKGAYNVDVYLYQDEKDSNGNWKYQICQAEIYGLDIVRDVALLLIACDTQCNCTSLGVLQGRLSTVNDGETVLVIGDSIKRRPHSFIDGRLSSTNFTFSLTSLTYKHIKKDLAATTFVSRVHGLTGSVNRGDSGSAVMDIAGNVIGMLLGISGDLNYCVTMEEIFKAYGQILDTLTPRFVGCTAHESALLGRTYWGEKSGKSIQEIDAFATAMNSQYIAVAHDGVEAHAFTFHSLRWETLQGSELDIEDQSQCLCEMNSFTDGKVFQHTEDGKVMCGCSENACRRNQFYQRRFREDNDRRWAIYERMNRNPEKVRHYVPSKESLAAMEDIADETGYWKQRLDKLRAKKEELVSEYKTYGAIVVAVTLCIASSLVICLHKRWKNTECMLKKANTERERLEKELSEKDVLQNSESETTNLLTQQ